MRTAINKKRIVLYAVCAFFFCLAGVFQAVDSSLPDFWHALFALLAHTILISLVVAWGISLIHRMVRKDLRAYFLTVAVLILFFLVVRMIRYGLTKDTDAFSRYLWYAYYVPQMFIPPTILLAAFSIESKKGKPLAKAWYFLYLPAVILLLLIFTNDVHEWAFALNFEGGFSYKHKTVFYIALAWEIAVTFTSLIVLILKCGISACRRKTWIPVTVFIVCAAVFHRMLFDGYAGVQNPRTIVLYLYRNDRKLYRHRFDSVQRRIRKLLLSFGIFGGYHGREFQRDIQFRKVDFHG